MAIALDTLNRSMPGSESSDEDMTAYVKAGDALRMAFDCAVVIVHHCGHEGTRPRGHSSLMGACDAQIAVKRDAADNIIATVELMKDGPQGGEFASRLEVVELGLTPKGYFVVPGEKPIFLGSTAGLRNIFYLRTISDVEALQPLMEAPRRLVIVGGGYIGLEAAAVAVKRGLAVTVLEAAPRVLARVTAPDLSKFYERIHREAGVDIRTGVTVSGFTTSGEDGGVGAAACADGQSFAADFVLIGIGLVPNTELAERAGLGVDDGIVVDEASRTDDRDTYGDCAMHAHHGFLRRKIRLESVPNALEQARGAAASITGRPIPAAAAPFGPTNMISNCRWLGSRTGMRNSRSGGAWRRHRSLHLII